MNISARPSTLRCWWLAARPKTLWAGVGPIFLGMGLAASVGGMDVGVGLLCLAGALLLQVGTNFCNDWADFVKGADTEERKGPKRMTQAGWISPGAMLAATVITFAAAAVVCGLLVARAGWPLAVVGVVSILAGVLYTAGPYPLAYLGLGDVFVLVFFGPVAVAGTFYVQVLELSWLPVWMGLGPGLLSVAILVVNNLRDIEGDAKAGKKTLAVRFGPTFARVEYTVCVAGAAGIGWALVMGTGSVDGVTLFYMVVATMPGLSLLPQVWTEKGEGLNPLLGKTAVGLLMYCMWFAVVWAR
ncbi:MAG TPA: 1,4-dihydroxy-2-naphthoate polyprenyltransferase [Kiritimatiellia bacterium]|nr:1,4-dihydroxy-2-naphthoate polyprenyltransferase [Kiritimatiellia bacterium]